MTRTPGRHGRLACLLLLLLGASEQARAQEGEDVLLSARRRYPIDLESPLVEYIGGTRTWIGGGIGVLGTANRSPELPRVVGGPSLRLGLAVGKTRFLLRGDLLGGVRPEDEARDRSVLLGALFAAGADVGRRVSRRFAYRIGLDYELGGFFSGAESTFIHGPRFRTQLMLVPRPIRNRWLTFLEGPYPRFHLGIEPSLGVWFGAERVTVSYGATLLFEASL